MTKTSAAEGVPNARQLISLSGLELAVMDYDLELTEIVIACSMRLFSLAFAMVFNVEHKQKQ